MPDFSSSNSYFFNFQPLPFPSHSGPELPCDRGHGRVRGDHPGRARAVHAGGQAQQPQGLRQRHRVGAALIVPYLHRRYGGKEQQTSEQGLAG